MSNNPWVAALKKYNSNIKAKVFTIPAKNTPGYAAVKKLQALKSNKSK